MNTSVWRIVAGREIHVKLRDKAFVISLLVTLLMIVVGGVLSVMLGDRPSNDKVVVTDDRAAAIVTTAGRNLSANGSKDTVGALRVGNDAQARARLADDDDLVYLHRVGGVWQLDGQQDPPSEQAASTRALADAVASTVMAGNAHAAGVDVTRLTAGTTMRTGHLVPTVEGRGMAPLLATVFGVLFLLSAMQFGYTMAGSVVEEKQSRIAEILLTAVRARQLLVGKVVGNTVLAIGELVLICAVAMVTLSFSTWSHFLTAALSSSVVWFLVFFLVGFVALASLFAAAGSLASRTEDVQTTAAPLMYIIMGVYFWAIFSLSSINGVNAIVGSYVPIASVVSMPTRMVSGHVAWWEPVLSILVTAAFAAASIWAAERIYRRSILQTGGRVSLRRAWRREEAVN